MGFMYTERCQIWRYKEEIVTKRKQTCRPLDGSLEAHNGKQIFTTLRWAHKDRCFFDWGFGQWRTCSSCFFHKDFVAFLLFLHRWGIPRKDILFIVGLFPWYEWMDILGNSVYWLLQSYFSLLSGCM